jgi:LCP family protein required for cell wall assembly
VVFHPWKAGLAVVLGILLGVTAFYAFELHTALEAVAVEQFDPASARAALGPSSGGTGAAVFVEPEALDGESPLGSEMADIRELLGSGSFVPRDVSPYSFGDPIPDEAFESYILLGTDASGFLADVIILALQPAGGGRPIMVSLPRDLYVWNECQETLTRLNTGLGGCSGMASGMEMMAIMIEDYTGIPIDHMARTTFSGFSRMVDAMGGVTVCVDSPTRDTKSGLRIRDAGCANADGRTALAWVRSRHPEERVNGKWVARSGSDYTRQRRQQDVLFQLAGKMANYATPASLTSRLSVMAETVRLDSSWSFASAISAAWRYRGISESSVARFSIDARSYRTPGGASVLVPTRYFSDQLAEVYSG